MWKIFRRSFEKNYERFLNWFVFLSVETKITMQGWVWQTFRQTCHQKLMTDMPSKTNDRHAIRQTFWQKWFQTDLQAEKHEIRQPDTQVVTECQTMFNIQKIRQTKSDIQVIKIATMWLVMTARNGTLASKSSNKIKTDRWREIQRNNRNHTLT